MNEFTAFWTSFYPNAHPTGWLMRAVNARWWVRFHSLPLSKRYAETEEERAILLRRQNDLAEEVLGEDQPCWLVQSQWRRPEDNAELSDEEGFEEARVFSLKDAFTFNDYDDDGEAIPWRVMAGHVRWRRGAFDKTLLRIADDQAAPTLWMSTLNGAVLAPYDGGVDLFVPSAEAANALRSNHSDWLSEHPAGL